MAVNSAAAQTLNDLREYLIKWEGYRTKPYICPTGHLTVGIGHQLSRKEKKKVYTATEIEQFFIHDVAVAKEAARIAFLNFDSLPLDIKKVLVSIIFTVGPNGILTLTRFRKHIDQNQYIEAGKQLYRYKWAKQVSKNRLEDHVETLFKAGIQERVTLK